MQFLLRKRKMNTVTKTVMPHDGARHDTARSDHNAKLLWRRLHAPTDRYTIPPDGPRSARRRSTLYHLVLI